MRLIKLCFAAILVSTLVGCAAEIIVPTPFPSIVGDGSGPRVDLIVPIESKNYVSTARAGISTLEIKFGRTLEIAAASALRTVFREVEVLKDSPHTKSTSSLTMTVAIKEASVSPGGTTLSSSSSAVTLTATLREDGSTRVERFIGFGQSTVSPRVDFPLIANNGNYMVAVRQACSEAMTNALDDLVKQVAKKF